MSANNNEQAMNIGFSSLFGNSPSASAVPQLTGPGFPNQFQAQAAHAQWAQLHQAQSLADSQQVHASPPISGISSGSLKRVPHKPPAISTPQTLSSTSSVARKKKQKLPEKQLHERVANFLPESAFYTRMLEFEGLVDDAVARKKAAVQEALMNPPCFQRILRIYIFNTFANQICTAPEKPNAEPPSWTLRIVGRILEEPMFPGQPSSTYPKFSSFMKRVAVLLDPKLYPDNHIIIWERAQSPALPDGFEIKRKGDQEFTVNIRLELNNLPEKFKVSPALKEVIGVEVDTRARIVHAIWQYINGRKLRIPDDPSFFICDPPLQNVFGEGMFKLSEVPQMITHHLSPPQPIHLQHRIKLSGNNPAGIECYDVLVDLPFPIHKDLNNFLASTDKTKELGVCEEAIGEALKKLQEHRRRRALFLGFSQSPVEFVNALVDSESKGIKSVAGEASHNERHSDIYTQPWYTPVYSLHVLPCISAFRPTISLLHCELCHLHI